MFVGTKWWRERAIPINDDCETLLDAGNALCDSTKEWGEPRRNTHRERARKNVEKNMPNSCLLPLSLSLSRISYFTCTQSRNDIAEKFSKKWSLAVDRQCFVVACIIKAAFMPQTKAIQMGEKMVGSQLHDHQKNEMLANLWCVFLLLLSSELLTTACDELMINELLIDYWKSLRSFIHSHFFFHSSQ